MENVLISFVGDTRRKPCSSLDGAVWAAASPDATFRFCAWPLCPPGFSQTAVKMLDEKTLVLIKTKQEILET